MNDAPVQDKARTTSQIIADAIADLHAQEQVVSRETLQALTGLRMSQIDDHVTRMIEDGRVRRLRAGVFVPVAPMPEPRAISLTDLPDGITIIEVGDHVLKLWPREVRTLAARLAGNAAQYSSIQAGYELSESTAEINQRLLSMGRQLRAVQAQWEQYAPARANPSGEVGHG